MSGLFTEANIHSYVEHVAASAVSSMSPDDRATLLKAADKRVGKVYDERMHRPK